MVAPQPEGHDVTGRKGIHPFRRTSSRVMRETGVRVARPNDTLSRTDELHLGVICLELKPDDRHAVLMPYRLES